MVGIYLIELDTNISY